MPVCTYRNFPLKTLQQNTLHEPNFRRQNNYHFQSDDCSRITHRVILQQKNKQTINGYTELIINVTYIRIKATTAGRRQKKHVRICQVIVSINQA